MHREHVDCWRKEGRDVEQRKEKEEERTSTKEWKNAKKDEWKRRGKRGEKRNVGKEPCGRQTLLKEKMLDDAKRRGGAKQYQGIRRRKERWDIAEGVHKKDETRGMGLLRNGGGIYLHEAIHVLWSMPSTLFVGNSDDDGDSLETAVQSALNSLLSHTCIPPAYFQKRHVPCPGTAWILPKSTQVCGGEL
jgi:hypothetical protein